MPIDLACPACSARLKAPETKAGKKARCGKCGAKFPIPGEAASDSSKGGLTPHPAGEVEEFELLPAASSPGLSSPSPSPIPDVQPITPPQPAASKSLAKSAAPGAAEALSLDDDDTPIPPEERLGAARAKASSTNTARLGQLTEPRRTYVRPAERKSSGVLLIAGLLGAVAIAGLVAAVIIHQNRKQSIEPETEPTGKQEEKTGVVPGEAPIAPVARAGTPTKDDSAARKQDRKAGASGVPAVMAALPAGTRTIQLRMPSPKPEYTQNRSGEPFSIDVPFEKVRRFFPHENRIARDTVIVWQSNDGVAGLGEQLTVDVLSGQTGTRIKRLEFEGEGEGKNPRCDFSPDGNHFAAASASGSITVWNLADESKILQGFDPYADKPEYKKAGLAALYFTSNPGHLVTISTAGAVHLFQIADRKQLGEFIPPHGLPGRIIAGRNVATDDARSSVVLAVGGTIHQVATAAPLTLAWQLDLGGEAGRSLGIAAVGVPGRIAYAFEAGTQKKERALVFCMPNDKPIFYRLPPEAGEATDIHWSGTNMAVVGTTRGAVWVESAEMTFLPVALAEIAGGKAMHGTTESYHWYVIPNPADQTKSLLLALGLPPQDFLDFRNAARAREPLFTVRLDEKGLWK